ncbi:ABC transporter ATP-binding protein [Pararobbsia silviterrae]|uniref:Spermidine/putrescine import ATP-binding protein PotA n=1 Tax=Pararobbsia silviterrae TaxID=1792498 RepID=A0A494XXR3_9BURK|nr:polyamine ABC transporter ATP-binding protein [Pararobbsia silviterrae]RKP54715.1 polyamine ABC transporter ATP-binding protein [Pararobbsia silviterrae]
MSELSNARAAGAGGARAGADPERFVEIVDVVKDFGGGTIAVDAVSLSIRKGEIFALLGSSGSGKSTLLRMLAGLETATSGKILIDGEDLASMPPYRRPVNMMFQSYALFPHMTVEGNVAFGLQQEKTPKAEIRERVAQVLELVQMSRYAKRKPHQLSGGQQQRVALARSLVKRPKVLLLDEPMSALDKQIRQRTQIEVTNILSSVGVTCIMVTHDQEEAMTMAHRLAVMSEGRIVQVGTPHEVYEFPNSRFSAEFIGSTNLFDGAIVEDEADHVHIESAALPSRIYVSHGISGTLGMNVSVSVRPERVAVSRTQPNQPYNWAAGTVTNLAYMGGYTLVHVVLDSGHKVVANVASLALSELGEVDADARIYVSWSAGSGVVLVK